MLESMECQRVRHDLVTEQWQLVKDTYGDKVLYDWISKTKLIIWHIFTGKGFPGGSAGKESSCNTGNLG